MTFKMKGFSAFTKKEDSVNQKSRDIKARLMEYENIKDPGSNRAKQLQKEFKELGSGAPKIGEHPYSSNKKNTGKKTHRDKGTPGPPPLMTRKPEKGTKMGDWYLANHPDHKKK